MSGLALIAGLVSTVIFASSMLPMIVKAVVTRDLESYSLGHLVLVNGGNAVHSFYVFSLPAGPIWALHCFHLATSVVMLVWFLRFAGPVHRSSTCPPLPHRPPSRPSSSAPARPAWPRPTTSPATVVAVWSWTAAEGSATTGDTSTTP